MIVGDCLGVECYEHRKARHATSGMREMEVRCEVLTVVEGQPARGLQAMP